MDRREARHFLNVVRSFEKANAEVVQYTELLGEIKVELSRLCDDFSKTFFHDKTKGRKDLCPAMILQIVLIFLTIAITLGIGWELTIPEDTALSIQVIQAIQQLRTAITMIKGSWGFPSSHTSWMFNFALGNQILSAGYMNPFSRSGFNYALASMGYAPAPFRRRSLQAGPELSEDGKVTMAYFNKFLEDSLSRELPVPRNGGKSAGLTERAEVRSHHKIKILEEESN